MKSAKPILLLFMAVSLAAPAIVRDVWPVYGPWLVQLAVRLARDIAPSQQILTVGTTVYTSRTEVHISAACAGAHSMQLFGLVGLAVLLLKRRRAIGYGFLILYLGSLAILWLHNLARLVSAIVYGETHYGTSEIIVVALSGLLALAAFRMARSVRGHSGAPAIRENAQP